MLLSHSLRNIIIHTKMGSLHSSFYMYFIIYDLFLIRGHLLQLSLLMLSHLWMEIGSKLAVYNPRILFIII